MSDRDEGAEENGAKELGVLGAWVLGALIIGFSLWFFTQNIRAGLLQENVNTVLASMGRQVFLDEEIKVSQGAFPLGTWFTIRNSNNFALVFAVMSDGIRFPCVALVSDAGVNEIIFLNASSVLKENINEGIINAYINRIERDMMFVRRGM
jgi:hypothetical protein